MPAKPLIKAKRHKKRKSRTEVESDISDISSASEDEKSPVEALARIPTEDVMDLDAKVEEPVIKTKTKKRKIPSPDPTEQKPKASDAESETTVAFRKFYMQKVAEEFAEDLDKIRGSDDFHDGALGLLIHALGQGTGVFTAEEQSRVVLAGVKE